MYLEFEEIYASVIGIGVLMIPIFFRSTDVSLIYD